MVKTEAERARDYRKRIRDDPEKRRIMREKERVRKSAQRKQKREEMKQDKRKLEQARAKKRTEMKKYYDKKKNATPSDLLDKSRAGKKKAKSIKNKQKYKENKTKLSDKKRQAILRTQKWRMRIKLKSPAREKNNESNSAFANRMTEYRAVRKVKETLPQTPTKKAAVVEKLITPKTSRALQDRGVSFGSANKKLELETTVASAVKTQLKILKPRGGLSKEKLQRYKILKNTLSTAPAKKHMRGMLNKYFEFKRRIRRTKTHINLSSIRKQRKDAIPKETRDLVTGFYLSPEVSREMPHKKEVVTKQDENENEQTIQKNYMTVTIAEAFGMFKQRHPDVRMGLTSFKKLKPFNVKKVSETSRRTCLCTTCSNLALKIEAIKHFTCGLVTRAPERKGEFKDLAGLKKSTLSAASVCRYDGEFPFRECLERRCKKSDCNRLDSLLKPLHQCEQDTIKWYQWEYTTVTYGGNNENTKSRITCAEKVTTVLVFLQELKTAMEGYAAHTFRALWQHRQLQMNVSSLKNGEILVAMDFSENYKCHFRDEVQSGYYDQTAVTVHPMMVYYTKQHDLYKHAIIGISPDIKHDWHLVTKFENKAIEIVSKLTPVDKVYEWTDGCAAQYKGKNSFYQLSSWEIPVQRNFFETSHGKSVCDGLGAVVKNGCSRAVVSGQAVLSNAEAVFNFCSEKFSHGPQRRNVGEISIWDVIFIPSSVHETPKGIPTLKGTRKLHSVRNTDKKFGLETRNLSCCCQFCLVDKSQECLNKEWVDDWMDNSMASPSNAPKENNDSPTETEVGTNVPNRFTEGQYVAVQFLGKTRSSLTIAVAKVIQVLQDELEVDFMKKSGNVYVWPENPDIWHHPKDDVICPLSTPKLLTARQQFSVDLTCAHDKVRAMFKHIKLI